MIAAGVVIDSIATPASYRFGRFLLDLRRGALLGDGEEVALRPKSFALLRYLVEHPDRVVGCDEIMRTVWPGVFVTDNSLAQCVMEIRRALADQGQLVLRTLPRRGYRFTASVSRQREPGFGGSPGPAGLGLPELVPVPPPGRPTLVVLPFVDSGGTSETAYFADGLTADLVTDLTRFQDLQVAGPQRHRGLAAPAQDPTGSELPDTARYTFSGNLRRAGGRIRVTAQLDDGQSGVRIWADRFDRSLDDLFAVQEDLADHIAALVEGQIGQDGLRRARRRPPASFSAYDWLLQGRDLHGRTTKADNQAARNMLDRALAADADYASAYAYQSLVAQRGFTLDWASRAGGPRSMWRWSLRSARSRWSRTRPFA